MAVTLVGSGSQTAVIGTEHFLSSPNVAGLFGMQIDLINMAAGDVVELRVYKMTIGSGTQRVTAFTSYTGAQAADGLIVMSQAIGNTLTDANATRFSLKQTFGTGRVFPWAVLNLEDFTNVASPTNITAGTITTVTNLTNAATAGDFTATMKTSVTTAATAATPTAAAVTAPVSVAAGQLFIKKNAILANFPFIMTDSTTNLPKTGLTVTATRRIDNGAFGACANAVTEVASGWYTIDFAAADLNGTTIAVKMTATGANPTDFTIVTQA